MDRIRLKVLGLSYSMSQAGAYALILADEQDMHRIPIVIGMPEAQSIAIQLEKMQTQRPLTHDLIKKLADALQVTLKEAFIYRLDSGIFYSELLFEKDTQQIKIDSRTSYCGRSGNRTDRIPRKRRGRATTLFRSGIDPDAGRGCPE